MAVPGKDAAANDADSDAIQASLIAPEPARPRDRFNRSINRRQFLRHAAFAGGGLAVATGVYTWRWEPHWVEVVERRLPIRFLPSALEGARLVQLTDLHAGPRVDDSYLIETFDLVRKLAPEIVVYTGDFISYETDIFTHTDRVFARLALGTHATFGILGNHDYGPRWAHPEIAERITTILTSEGVQILRNEIAEVDGLQIAGLDDFWAHRFNPVEVLPNVDSQRAALVLTHNPDTVDQAGWGRYAGWILSGHTHGGQCKPPFLPPPLLPVRNQRYTSGEFVVSRTRQLYISRGIGHLLRVRFNVRPEVTLFHLTRA